MKTKEKTIQSISQEMLDNMEQKERTNGDKFYCNKKEIEWQKKIIKKAHEEALPDDYKYNFIFDALCTLTDCTPGEEEEAIDEIEPDCYTSNLTEWLRSRNDRIYYLTQALEEFHSIDGFQALSIAQQIEKKDVARLVLEGIKEYIDNN